VTFELRGAPWQVEIPPGENGEMLMVVSINLGKFDHDLTATEPWESW